MSTKKKWLGKILKEINGYKVRQMGSNRIVKIGGGKEKNFFTPNGSYGVYAGRKKLIKDSFKSSDDAFDFAKTL